MTVGPWQLKHASTHLCVRSWQYLDHLRGTSVLIHQTSQPTYKKEKPESRHEVRQEIELTI